MLQNGNKIVTFVSNAAAGVPPLRVYNTRPGFLSNGAINVAEITAAGAVPPSTVRTIGDALNEKKLGFGGGFNAAARFDNGSTNPIDVMIGTAGDWYCDIGIAQSFPVCDVHHGQSRASADGPKKPYMSRSCADIAVKVTCLSRLVLNDREGNGEGDAAAS